MIFRKPGLVFGLATCLSVATMPELAVAEQVETTAGTGLLMAQADWPQSTADIAKAITEISSSTLPPDVIEVYVNIMLAGWITSECPDLRVNQAKEHAAGDRTSRKYSSRGFDGQDFNRHMRNLPKEKLQELGAQYLYVIGLREDTKADFCAVGRSEMVKDSVLGSFLLE